MYLRIVDTKITVSSLGTRIIQYRIMFIKRVQQYSRNFQELNLLDDVFLIRDFVVSFNIGIWQGFCFSSKKRLPYV
jgi:hypothetical protein